MENKYYTPSIEEFHEGFSHEYKGPLDTKWHKEDFKLKGPNPNFSWFLTEGHFRVKYLDREDIESLGWEYMKTHAGLNEDYFELSGDIYYMDFDYDNNFCRIAMEGEGDVTRFSGTIKNKSELKKLLKQLGI